MLSGAIGAKRAFPHTLFGILLLALSLARLMPQASPAPGDAAPRAGWGGFGSLPLNFEPNAGQVLGLEPTSDPSVRFMAHGYGGALFFTPGEVVLSLRQPSA